MTETITIRVNEEDPVLKKWIEYFESIGQDHGWGPDRAEFIMERISRFRDSRVMTPAIALGIATHFMPRCLKSPDWRNCLAHR